MYDPTDIPSSDHYEAEEIETTIGGVEMTVWFEITAQLDSKYKPMDYEIFNLVGYTDGDEELTPTPTPEETATLIKLALQKRQEEWDWEAKCEAD